MNVPAEIASAINRTYGTGSATVRGHLLRRTKDGRIAVQRNLKWHAFPNDDTLAAWLAGEGTAFAHAVEYDFTTELPPAIQRLWVLLALAATVLGVWWVISTILPSPQPQSQPTSYQDLSRTTSCYEFPRDEALRALGWLAGNSESSPDWHRIQKIVGEDSDAVSALLLLPGPAEPARQLDANLTRYREYRDAGRSDAYDPDQSRQKIDRVTELQARVGRCLD